MKLVHVSGGLGLLELIEAKISLDVYCLRMVVVSSVFISRSISSINCKYEQIGEAESKVASIRTYVSCTVDCAFVKHIDSMKLIEAIDDSKTGNILLLPSKNLNRF